MDWPYPEHFMREFFGLYSTLPSLWNPRSPEYQRYRSYQRDTEMKTLLEKYREVEPEATKAYLSKKMGILRSQFKLEKKRSEEQGRPMRKFFKLLLFLQDETTENTKKIISEKPKSRKLKSKDPLDIEQISEDEDVIQEEILDCPESSQENGLGEDRFDHCTKAWILSLQSVSRDQQIIAERIIDNILFEAQVGNLTTRTPFDVAEILRKNWGDNI